MRALALALVALAGCNAQRTEMVVAINVAGLRVGTDIDSVHLHVVDRTIGESGPVFDSATLLLCHDALTTNCQNLPVTLTLIPGDQAPSDSVRVLVEGKLGGPGGRVRIADAAIFNFTRGQSSRLDFILYANCLDNTLDCAKRDQVCSQDGSCQNLMPSPVDSMPDLALPVLDGSPHDFAMSGDLAGADLSMSLDSGSDFSLPPLDFSGGGTFDFASCGLTNGYCCPGQMCNLASDVCNGVNMCVNCGNLSELCCGGSGCFGGLHCRGTCQMCGGQGEVCCSTGQMCDPGLACVGGAPGNCQPISVSDLGTGTGWTKLGTTGTSMQLNAVWASSATEIYAVGLAGAIVRSTNGTVFVNDAGASATDLYGVWGDGTNVYAVGANGLVLRRAGANSWVNDGFPGASTLRATWSMGPGNTFAVGDSQTLGHRAASWSTLCPTGANDAHGIWGFMPTGFAVVGTNGFIGLTYPMSADGGSCPMVDFPSSGTINTLNGIFGNFNNWMVIAGDNTILESSSMGMTWSPSVLPIAGSTTYNAVWVAPGPSQDGYIVGNVGTVLHNPGVGWSEDAAGVTNNDLHGVFGLNGTVWAVGASGTILKK